MHYLINPCIKSLIHLLKSILSNMGGCHIGKKLKIVLWKINVFEYFQNWQLKKLFMSKNSECYMPTPQGTQ